MTIFLCIILFAFHALPLDKYTQSAIIGVQGIAVTLFLLAESLGGEFSPSSTWNGSLEVSFLSITAQLGLLSYCSAIIYLGLSNHEIGLLALATLFCVLALGGIATTMAQDFALVISQLEIQSYATYLMIANKLGKTVNPYGYLSYFLISGFATAGLVMGWGICLLEGETLSSTKNLSRGLSSWILIPSFAIKLGAYPFHAWVPLVYNESGLLSVLVVAGLPQLAILLLMNGAISITPLLAIVVPIASVVVGSVCVAAAVKPWGFIALSGISQLGFTLLAMNLTSSGIVLFNFFYALTLVTLGGVIWAFASSSHQLSYWRGIANTHIILGLLSSLLLLSLGGVPPIAGFYTKAELINHLGAQEGYYLSILLLISSLPSLIGYLRIALTILGVSWETPHWGNRSFFLFIHKEAVTITGTIGLGLIGLSYGPPLLLLIN